MNRRGFLSNLCKAIAISAVAPHLIEKMVEFKPTTYLLPVTTESKPYTVINYKGINFRFVHNPMFDEPLGYNTSWKEPFIMDLSDPTYETNKKTT